MAEYATGGYFHTESTAARPNFIGSEVGLIKKTVQVPASLGKQDGKFKIVPAGTVIPANDATAQGVLFEDANVTNGDRVGAIVTSGHLLGKQLPAEPTAEAQEALLAKGLDFDDWVPAVPETPTK